MGCLIGLAVDTVKFFFGFWIFALHWIALWVIYVLSTLFGMFRGIAYVAAIIVVVIFLFNVTAWIYGLLAFGGMAWVTVKLLMH